MEKQYGGRSGAGSRRAHLVLVSLTLVGLFASANAYGSTDLGSLLLNPSFELGNQTSPPLPGGSQDIGCPVDWHCNTVGTIPGGTSYAPVANTLPGPLTYNGEYTPGSDGLGGGLIVPDGNDVVNMPSKEGAASMFQDIPTTWDDTQTYTLDLWVGTPLIDPLDGIKAGPITRADVYLFGDGSLLPDPNAYIVIAPPTVGQWQEDIITFTPTAADNGKTIGLEFYVDTTLPGGASGNDDTVNFDIKPGTGTPSVPEPGSFLLIGAGLVSLAYVSRVRAKR